MDQAVGIYFKGPKSFTGKDIVRFPVSWGSHSCNEIWRVLYITVRDLGPSWRGSPKEHF